VPALTDDALGAAPTIALADALAASSRREEHDMAIAAIDGARAAQRASTSAFLPTVAVALDYGVQGNRYAFDRNHDVAVGSVVLQWNLFNGGQDDARRQGAAAVREGAGLQRAEIERQIALDVRTSWDAVQVARETLVAATARLTAARATFTLVDRRYAEGLASHLEWSDARAQYTAAQLNEVMTRYMLAARGVDLERAAALRTIPNN
jgi:outer membrane protein TolC